MSERMREWKGRTRGRGGGKVRQGGVIGRRGRAYGEKGEFNL